jgi:AcrR family transcriptional regulator
MAARSSVDLKPRKQPRQSRSQATVDAIFEATIQVLLAEGLPRLTTIRVAERAGVSVGTLYQYYPHKQALLFSVLEQHLGRVGTALQEAAESVHHKRLRVMIATVVEAFVWAKTERLEESQALYAVAAELDSVDLVRNSQKRGRAALGAMLATASDAKFDDLPTVTFMLAAAMSGPTRVLLEGGAPVKMIRQWGAQLEALCLSYLESQKR